MNQQYQIFCLTNQFFIFLDIMGELDNDKGIFINEKIINFNNLHGCFVRMCYSTWFTYSYW